VGFGVNIQFYGAFKCLPFYLFRLSALNRSQIEKREYFSRMLLLFEFHPHPSVCRGLCFSLWHIVALAKSFAFAPPLSL